MIQLSYCPRTTWYVNAACSHLWVMTHGKDGECTSEVERRETTHVSVDLVVCVCSEN